MTAPTLAIVAARCADDKLGQNTMVLSMVEAIGVVDAFVITSGRNARQVRTIAEEIERVVKETQGRSPAAIEGLADASWVLMDYGDVVIHIFLEETRAYYDLEHLWGGVPRISWSDSVSV
jgi:ribosome-associated protein